VAKANKKTAAKAVPKKKAPARKIPQKIHFDYFAKKKGPAKRAANGLTNIKKTV
jgi:hypothetical protein